MRLLICLVTFLVAVWVACASPLLRLSLTANRVNAEVCPDGKSECISGETCCPLEDVAGYTCCPLENAVCCTGGQYCCPTNHTCNGSMCVHTTNNGTFSHSKSTEHPSRGLDAVICPDKNKCSSGTCCQQSSGVWGCCPFEKAVCCEDKLHCCPQEFDCDTMLHTCIRMEKHMPTFLSNTADHFSPNVVKCPDSATQCPDGNTCCKGTSSAYVCCPLPNASCCNDNKHCCPEGFECLLSNGTYTCGKPQFENQWLHRKLS